MTTEFKRLQLRGYPAATWTGTNPVLLEREPGIETDTGKMKIGDGVTAWNALAYFTTGVGSGDIVGPAAAVGGNLAVFDGTTGKLLTDGGVNIGALAPKDSPTFTGPVGGITGAMVGLGNVPNVNATIANNVALSDSGGYYSTDTVEAALQVVGAYLAAHPPPPVPTLSAPATAAGAEGESALFTVALSSATTVEATATVTINHVTTVAGDITALDVQIAGVWTVITSGGTITLPVGTANIPVRVRFEQDIAAEGDETFTVVVVGVTGVSGTATTTVTVADNGVGAVPSIAFVGTKQESIGDLAITLPSLAIGDIALVLVQTAHQIPATPAGWNVQAGVGIGTAGAANSTRVSLFWRQATAVDTPASVTFVDPGDHMVAVPIKVTGGDTVDSPYLFNNQYSTTTGGAAVWISAGTATIPKNALVFYAMAHAISTTAPQFNTYTPSSVLTSFAEQFDDSTTIGVGGGLGVAAGAFLAGGALTTTQVALASSAIRLSLLVFAIVPTQPIVPPAPDSSGAIIKQATIDGMQSPNEGVQLGYQRSKYAGVGMGLVAKGTNTPTYWNGPAQYKDADQWTAISPWWNLLPLQGNAANSGNLEIGTMMLLTRAKGTNNYTVLYKGKSGWCGRYNANASARVGGVTGTAGTIPGYESVTYPLIPQPSDDTLHGGGGTQTIDATLMDNLIIILAARITGPDVAIAKYAMWAGGDYYPFLGYNVGANPPGWVPNICTGRLARVTGDWKLFACAPLDNPGRGAEASNFTYGTVGVYSSDAQFKANPLPNIDGLLPPPPASNKILGNITLIGDSLFKGHATDYVSPAQRIGQLLTSGSYTYTWVGTSTGALPGNIPCSAQGGWTLADIQADLDVHLGSPPGINDLSIKTAVISIGTNSLATAASGIAAYLTDLATAMGGLSSTKRILVCAPNQLGYFNAGDYSTLTTNMQNWVAANPYSYYVNLTTANLVSGDYSDGTHWLTSGADKIANVIYNAIENLTAAP